MRECGAGHFLARFRADDSPERIRRAAPGLAWLAASRIASVCRAGPGAVRALVVAQGRIHAGHETLFGRGTACRRAGAPGARGRSVAGGSGSSIERRPLRAGTDSGTGRNARAYERAKAGPASEDACREAGKRSSTPACNSSGRSGCRRSHGTRCASDGGRRPAHRVESDGGYRRASRSAVRRQSRWPKWGGAGRDETFDSSRSRGCGRAIASDGRSGHGGFAGTFDRTDGGNRFDEPRAARRRCGRGRAAA